MGQGSFPHVWTVFFSSPLSLPGLTTGYTRAGSFILPLLAVASVAVRLITCRLIQQTLHQRWDFRPPQAI
jgi:hypothetical protein